MTEAQTILKMIESVDPADTAVLDEIDARVWCCRDNYEYGYNVGTGKHCFREALDDYHSDNGRI